MHSSSRTHGGDLKEQKRQKKGGRGGTRLLTRNSHIARRSADLSGVDEIFRNGMTWKARFMFGRGGKKDIAFT